MNYKIGILGCGWLGLPLAVSLIEKGHRIHGSSTSEDKLEILKSKGILPFLIKLGTDRIEGDITGFLDELDIVVINVPPGMRKAPGRKYFEEMKAAGLSDEEMGQICGLNAARLFNVAD